MRDESLSGICLCLLIFFQSSEEFNQCFQICKKYYCRPQCHFNLSFEQLHFNFPVFKEKTIMYHRKVLSPCTVPSAKPWLIVFFLRNQCPLWSIVFVFWEKEIWSQISKVCSWERVKLSVFLRMNSDDIGLKLKACLRNFQLSWESFHVILIWKVLELEDYATVP